MDNNKIIKTKKENKVKAWCTDHLTELVLFTGVTASVTTIGLISLAVKIGYKAGKGPDIDEWCPAPFKTLDGHIGIRMMGLKEMEDGGALMLDHKDFVYSKPEYARNIANNILKMADEIEAGN